MRCARLSDTRTHPFGGRREVIIRFVRAVTSLVALVAGVTLFAQQADLEVIRIRENVFMIAGAGSNVTVQFGADGAVVVDAGESANADALVAAIEKITPQPIRYVIDTSDDREHVGGNEKVAKAGRRCFRPTTSSARA